MKAIILAAGRGSRMGDETADKPKCLAKLVDRSLLSWQISALKDAGLDDVVVVGGYRKDMLVDSGCEVLVNERWEQTNMVQSLFCAGSYLMNEDCIVSYADIVYHPKIIESIKQAKGDIVISYDRLWEKLWRLRFEDPLSDAETFKVDDDGLLTEIGQTPRSVDDIQGQYMGLLKFTPAGWAGVDAITQTMSSEDLDKLDMTALLNKVLMVQGRIETVGVDGRWCEADNVNDLQLYQQQLVAVGDSPWIHDWRWE